MLALTTESAMTRNDVALLGLLATGLPADSVARRLNLSPRTLRRRLREVCDKVGAGTPIEAVAWAARRNLI